jgi:hypothetical protein
MVLATVGWKIHRKQWPIIERIDNTTSKDLVTPQKPWFSRGFILYTYLGLLRGCSILGRKNYIGSYNHFTNKIRKYDTRIG